MNVNVSFVDFFFNYVFGLLFRFVVYLFFFVCFKNILFNYVIDGCNK